MGTLNEKVVTRIQKVAGKLITKPLTKKLESLPLERQVFLARKMMRQTGLLNFRADFLKETGFPDDIRELKDRKKWNKDQIKAYYWGCPEFREFWDIMQMEETHFDLILDKVFSPH